jgi:hypothetical protein
MGMKNSLAVTSLFAALVGATALQAQSLAPKLELYGGYDYTRFNINSDVAGQPPSQTFNGNGGGGEVTYNANNWLAFLGAVDGLWATNSSKAGAAMPYLFGPRAYLRRGKVTPFANVLFGGVLTSSGIATFGWQSHFAMAAGGGIDVRVSKHVALRPVQAEYLMTKIPDGLNNRQNNFRVGAGIVFRFG